MDAKQERWIAVHPLMVRITHWINVIAVLLMIASGWRIYNADPIFDFSFPDELTLGGWLAGALQWHFAAMWLLVLNGLVYVRSEEHTSELQSHSDLVCRLLLEKKNPTSCYEMLDTYDTSFYDAVSI